MLPKIPLQPPPIIKTPRSLHPVPKRIQNIRNIIRHRSQSTRIQRPPVRPRHNRISDPPLPFRRREPAHRVDLQPRRVLVVCVRSPFGRFVRALHKEGEAYLLRYGHGWGLEYRVGAGDRVWGVASTLAARVDHDRLDVLLVRGSWSFSAGCAGAALAGGFVMAPVLFLTAGAAVVGGFAAGTAFAAGGGAGGAGAG